MRLRRWACVLVLASTMAAPALGLGPPADYRGRVSAPALEGEAEVAAHRLVRVAVSGEFDFVDWEVEPAGLADVEVSADRKSIVFSGPGLTYRVEAACINWEAKTYEKASGTFTILGGPSPDPTPDPDPVPPPPPPPVPPDVVTGPLHVIYLSDVDDLDQAAALVRSSPTIGPTLAGLDARWHAYDDDAQAEPERGWVAWYAANDGGTDPGAVESLPALVVAKEDGEVVLQLSQRIGTAPPAMLRSEDGIVGTVKALRGQQP